MDGGMMLFDQPQQMLQLTEILETIVSNPNIRAEVEKWPKEQQGVQCETVAQVQETAAATTAVSPAQCSPAMEPGDDVKVVKEEPVTPGAAKRLNGTDKVSSRTKCPSFLKTLTENSLNSWMHIPKAFLELHSSEIQGSRSHRVKLEGPSGDIWLIAMYMMGKGPHGFRQGWKAFITDNHLKKGDRLLFTLISTSHFTVRVFDENGLEAVAAADSKLATNNTAQFDRGGGGGGGRSLHNCKVRKERDNNTGDNDTPATYSTEDVKLPAHDDDDDDDDDGLPENDAKRLRGEPNPSLTQCPDATRCTRRSKAPVTRLHDTKQAAAKRRRAAEPCSKGAAAAAPGTKKEVRKSSSSKPSNWSGGGKQMEKFGPGFFSKTWISQRQPVTETEREQAMIAAHALQTQNPSVVLLMRPSQVYRGFWLCLPIEFARIWLPKKDTDVILEDEAGFGWPARWLSNENRQGLSGGWANFSRDHCLEEGDMCVFEIVDAQHWIILVHIFRVVDVKIVPGSRDDGKGHYKLVRGDGCHSSIKTAKTKAQLASKKNLNRTKNPTKRHMWRAPRLDQVTRKQQQRSRGVLKVPIQELSHKTTTTHADGMTATKAAAAAFDEIDIKPKVNNKLEPGAIPKIPTSATNNYCIPFATVKIEKEMVTPGIDMKPNVEQLQFEAQELNPSLYDLRRNNHNVLNNNNNNTGSCFEEKPKIVVTSSRILKLAENPPRMYYRVSRLIDRRKVENGELEFKVELEQGPTAVLPKEQQQQQPPSWTATKDEEGYWWVPYSRFSSDFRSCSID